MLVRDQHCDGVPNYATKCINFRLINTLIMIKPTPNFAQQCRALFPTRRPCDHKGTGRQLRKWCAWCLMRAVAVVDRRWDIADCTLLTLGSFHLNGVYVLGCMIPETGHRDKFTQMCVRHFAWFVFLAICTLVWPGRRGGPRWRFPRCGKSFQQLLASYHPQRDIIRKEIIRKEVSSAKRYHPLMTLAPNNRNVASLDNFEYYVLCDINDIHTIWVFRDTLKCCRCLSPIKSALIRCMFWIKKCSTLMPSPGVSL